MDRYQTDWMEAINAEIQRVKDRLSPDMLRRFQFRQAMILLRRNRYPEAIQKMEALLQDPDCEPALLASLRSRLVESYAYSGDPQTAIEIGSEGEAWFDNMLKQTPVEDPQRENMERDFGWLCNTLGLAYRTQNKLEQTVEYYKKALDHLALAGGAHSQIASTKNNLGFVYHRLGRDDEALAECDTALKLRQRLGSRDQLGYSYNVLGRIYVDQLRVEEALSHFEHAIRTFREADNERGEALVYIAYGQLMRQWGWYKEKFAKESQNPEREEYCKARDMFDKAIATFRQLGDLPNLLEALNEQGTLLRQQMRWDKAIACFQESADLSRQIGNRYREADSLQDIGILYSLSERPDMALEHARRACEIAQKINAYYLFAKGQRVIGNALFARQDYDQAFEAASNACIYILRLDPYEIGDSPAKKELSYDEFVDWVSEMILALPSRELAQAKAEYLIQRWQQAESGERHLADLYPGFITRMRSLAQDYSFLAKEE